MRRVPKDWVFPKLNLMHMYLLWHCGNESQRVGAMKLWDSVDVNSMKVSRTKVNLSEVRRLMKVIDSAAIAAGVPPQKVMTHAQVLSCFNAGKSGIDIPRETATGRRRNIDRMSWHTVAKLMPKVRRRGH